VRLRLDILDPMWRFRFIPRTYDIRCERKSRLDGTKMGSVDGSKGPALSRTGLSDVLGGQVRKWPWEWVLLHGERVALYSPGWGLILPQLDSSYQLIHTLSPIGDQLVGDFHDFRLTENGTALVTIYDIIPADLSSLNGPTFGWIYDGIFQEIDIATGDLVFEWRASEHYQIDESFMPLDGGKTRDEPYDFFHINSVDKDPDGNYYISSRHMHTVTCLNPSGDVLWILGGQRNHFTDLSSGSATNFTWQHDARWHPNHSLTMAQVRMTTDSQRPNTAAD